jgi:hypothetical protein
VCVGDEEEWMNIPASSKPGGLGLKVGAGHGFFLWLLLEAPGSFCHFWDVPALQLKGSQEEMLSG